MIVRYGFRELDEHSDEERSAGWVNILDPLDHVFRGEEFFKEGYIALSMRVDVRRVPAKALAQHGLAEERAIKERENVPFLPKSRRKEIREQVRWRLLKRAIPRSDTYDMVWDLSVGAVTFAGLNAAVIETFEELFQKTFRLPLVQLFPYQLALREAGRIGLDPSRLEAVQPSRWVVE
jgi:DNA recombination-dependent growth factor C